MIRGTCVNCAAPLTDPPKVFQGVLICDDCFKMVSHYVQKTKEELNRLFLVYTDLLRVALVKGEMRPPTAAPGKEMPMREFTRAFQTLTQRVGGLRASQEEVPVRQGSVPEVRMDNDHPHEEVRGG